MNPISNILTLLDTILDYIFYFGPLGKHVQTNQENPVHVGRLRRPTRSGFGDFKYRCFDGDPK